MRSSSSEPHLVATSFIMFGPLDRGGGAGSVEPTLVFDIVTALNTHRSADINKLAR